jgi:hypothetical protein
MSNATLPKSAQRHFKNTLNRLTLHETTLNTRSASAEARGGEFGTISSINIMRALTESGFAGYKALSDDFQVADLAVLPTLYPQAMVLVGNYQQAQKELAELDTQDILALVREVCDLTERLSKELAQGQEEVRSEISPEQAWNAVKLSLNATRDTIKIGLRTFKNGFDLTKLPELFQLFPAATSLATNAPLAVQGWAKLNLQQKGEAAKLVIDILIDILSSLQTQTA